MSLIQRIVRSLRSSTPPVTVDTEAGERTAQQLIDEGNAAEKAGSLDAARRCYEQAIVAAPRLSRAHMNLGNALLAAGAPGQALDAYKTAVELDANSAPAQYNLGNAYWHLNQLEAALRCYHTAADLDPTFVLPWIAIANALGSMGRIEDASAACRHAIKVDPGSAEAHFLLSIVLSATGRSEDAAASLRAALAIRPDHRFALGNLANYLEDSLQFEDALVPYRKLAELDPDSVEAQTKLLYRLSLSISSTPESLFAAHVAAGERIEQTERQLRRGHANSRDPERVLRVGFVSADLTTHAVAYFAEPVIRRLAHRTELALYAYHNNPGATDTTHRIRSCFLRWHVVDQMDDAALEALIRADGIDVLIDLSGHTEGNRLRLFARKPAPVQASWIGYPGTTGLSAMDYYIGDPYFLPQQTFAAQFVEKLAYLPRASPFQPLAAAPAVNPLPALSGRPFTFGSFNRPNKFNPHTVSLWSGILRSVPEARMLLASITDDKQIAILRRWFAKDGIDRDRLIFHHRCATTAYLGLHHDVDLCLDTFPYSGGTTTLHALWMGVPTLTLAGTTPAGRQTTSLLAHVDLDAFVTHSPEEFIRIGAQWAQRTAELAEIRADLRQRMQPSPLCDADLIAARFAQALRIMWRRWCADAPAELIDAAASPSNGTRA